MGTKSDGTLWSWGYGNYGEIGNNTSGSGADYSSPVQIPGTTWDLVAMGRYAAGAIKTDGTLWMWGGQDSGSLGQNEQAVNRSSPVQIPGTTWGSIFITSTTAYSVKTDGTFWGCGGGGNGQMGLNLADGPSSQHGNVSSPTQIPGTTWSADQNKWGGEYFSAMNVKTDGTLWVWGRNPNGNLGQNNTVQYSSPVQIPGTTWKYVTGSAQGYISAGIKTDGTLWTWGGNSEGGLGHNDRAHRSSPVQVPGTNWDVVKGGHTLLVATKTDGTLWSWGQENFGALGHNQNVKYSSPIQIPGTWGYPLASSFSSFNGGLKEI